MTILSNHHKNSSNLWIVTHQESAAFTKTIPISPLDRKTNRRFAPQVEFPRMTVLSNHHKNSSNLWIVTHQASAAFTKTIPISPLDGKPIAGLPRKWSFRG